MSTAMKAALWWIVPFVILVITGCGVQIEIAPTLAPTPFPHPIQPPGAAANGLPRSVASPRLVFSGQPKAQVFIAALLPDVYLIRNRPVMLSVDYDATWFEGTDGTGHIRLTVYARADTAQGWALYDSVERTVMATGSPSNVHDSLTVTLGRESAGRFEVRAEVTVAANNRDGEAKQAGTAEFRAIVLDDPGIVKPDFAAVKPAFGDLDAAVMLADWRGWSGGPCGLVSIARDDPSSPEVQSGCNAALANNPTKAAQDMTAALEKAHKPDLVAHLNDCLGLVSIAQKNFDQAAKYFTDAVSAWQSAGRAWELMVSLHNLAAVRIMQGNGAAALALIIQLQELHAQSSDELGQMLTQANVGLISENRDAILQAHTYFKSNGLPQAAVTEIWLRQIADKP